MIRRCSIVALMALAFLALPSEVVSTAHAKGKYKITHKDRPRSQPVDGHALVYVLRPTFTGFAIKMWAFADDQLLGVTNGKNYSFAQVPAGERILWSKSENINAIQINLEAGKTYYMRQRVRMGAFRAATLVEIIDAEEAEPFFRKCKYVTHTEAARDKAATYVKKHLERARKVASHYPETNRGRSSLPDHDEEE